MVRGIVGAVAGTLVAHVAAQFHVAPLEHQFVLKTDLATPLSDYTADLVSVDRIVIVGGCEQEVQAAYSDCEAVSGKTTIFNPSTETFTEVGEAPNKRHRHASAVRGNELYVMGGKGDAGVDILAIDVLNLDTLTWTTLDTPFPIDVTDSTGFEFDGIVYMVGGYISSQDYAPSDVTYTIDAEGAIGTDGPVLPTHRGDARAVRLGELVYVVGGWNANDWSVVGSLDVFDGTAWTTHPVPSDIARGDMAATAMNGRLYIFGGEFVSGNVTARIEIFTPSTGTWQHGGDMPFGRQRMQAVGTSTNQIYMFGGQIPNEDGGWNTVKSVEAYVETTGLYSMPTLTLHGAGTSNPEFVFSEVMDLFEKQSRLPLKMSYRAVGSSTGIKEFAGNEQTAFLPANMFGAGDIPLPAATYDAVTSRGHEVAQLPFMFGAIGIYVNVPEQRASGERIVLEACDLAKIYTGEITLWSELAADDRNSFLEGVDEPIHTVHRNLGSSSTSGFTTFMKSGCEATWPDATSGSGYAWPCDSNDDCSSTVAEGSSGVLGFLTNTPYSIGYLSVSHGFPQALQAASLVNKDGEIVPEPTPDAIKAAGASFSGWPATPFEDFSAVSLVNAEGADSWPIVLVSYMFVRKDLSGMGSSGQLLNAFLQYMLGETMGQSILSKYDFVPLPENVLSLSKSALDELVLPADSTPFTFETSTDAFNGAGPFVLSGKRRTYATYVESSLSSEIASLEAAIFDNGVSVVVEEGDAEGDEVTRNIAIAALIFGIVNFLLFIIVLVLLCGLRSAVNKAKRGEATRASKKAEPPTQPIERENSVQSNHDSEVSESAAVQFA